MAIFLAASVTFHLSFFRYDQTLHFHAFHCIRKSTNLHEHSQRQPVQLHCRLEAFEHLTQSNQNIEFPHFYSIFNIVIEQCSSAANSSLLATNSTKYSAKLKQAIYLHSSGSIFISNKQLILHKIHRNF